MEFYEVVTKRRTSREFLKCHYPCIPVKGLKRRICFQTESFCHHLVCDRKYLSGGNSGRAVLLHAHPAEPGARYCQGKTESFLCLLSTYLDFQASQPIYIYVFYTFPLFFPL